MQLVIDKKFLEFEKRIKNKLKIKKN